MEFLIGGLLIGITLTLTVINTIKLRRKPKQEPVEVTEEQKRREEAFQRLMNYRGTPNND